MVEMGYDRIIAAIIYGIYLTNSTCRRGNIESSVINRASVVSAEAVANTTLIA